MTLQEIYNKYSAYTDKGTTHCYIPMYESLLAPYRKDSTIMELGLSVGGSLAVWSEYFENSRIIGVETNNNFPKEHFPKCEIIICDCTKPELLDHLGDTTFDVIIDDASHDAISQMISFNLLKSRMKKGGLYVIEDIQNVDETGRLFRGSHENYWMVDFREEKGRYDDVAIVYKF